MCHGNLLRNGFFLGITLTRLVRVSMCGFNTGGWSGWGNWAECSSECGGGVQTRTRSCQSPPEEAYLCEGVLEEGRPCNAQSCIGKFYAHICMHVTVRTFSCFLSLLLFDTSFFLHSLHFTVKKKMFCFLCDIMIEQ